MKDTENMSDVEKLFIKMQEKLGGNVQWVEIPVPLQLRFIDSVNVIMEISSIRYQE